MRRPLWLLCLLAALAHAGDWPRALTAYRGATPTIDGRLAGGEWADASHFTGVRDWTPQFSPTTDDRDLALDGWVKHDGTNLYFAFRITDDCLYGIDTPRWSPKENPHHDDLTPRGFPWFGDEMELLLNASNTWSRTDNENAAGDGASWQMVCNLTKSRLGGIGPGGLLEGEPRSRKLAWDNYQRFILSGAMVAAARLQRTAARAMRHNGAGTSFHDLPQPRGGVYVIEWLVRPDPCLEVQPGVFWSPDLGEVRMGLNIALGDLDTPEAGAGNWGNFHHEDWWTGEKNKRTWLKQYGTLIVEPGPMPSR
ncbi:MAG: hypothetical protein HYU66_01035 [Armatimonadetes bacterium]|nr:hypothetical protein [Armatimonadota bacterium]